MATNPYNYSFDSGEVRRRPAADSVPAGSRKLTAGEKGKKVGRVARRWVNTGNLDAPFLIIVVVLLCIGLVMMFSAGYTYAYYKYNDSLYFIKKQLGFAVLGLLVMYAASRFNYRRLNSGIAVGLYGFSVLLLIFTFVYNTLKPQPGKEDFKRWLDLPGLPGFQPSEIAKFALILFLAYNIARQYGIIDSKNTIDSPLLKRFDAAFTSKIRNSFYRNASTNSMAITLYYAFIISVVCVLVLIENHLSGTILIFLIGVSMMWLGGVKKGYFAILFIFVAAAVALVLIKPDVLPGYAKERIVAFLDKDYSPLHKRWQTNQSLRAIASGGPFGLGLGNSRQKHMYVSEPQNDFIFAIVCEELGFVGGLLIISLFALLVWRAFHIAAKTADVFGATLAMGIALQVGIQVILNIAVVTDAIPNTGISLPFFSYGGTSLIMLLGEMGLILSVSRKSTVEKA